jgi:hypothetical protein
MLGTARHYGAWYTVGITIWSSELLGNAGTLALVLVTVGKISVRYWYWQW